ncbi:aminodeoxychorismate lyase [Lachnospiraceae bacterium]|nr:aminodeoxychorismate lyase [Lachnospiraceae bacterium]
MRNSKIILNMLSSFLSILILVLVVFVFLRAGHAAYDLGYRIFTEPALEEAPGRDMTVELDKGMSVLEIGSLLEEKRLVDNGVLFALQLQFSDYRDKIKSGTYTLNTSQTAKEMMQVMAEEEIEGTAE